MLKTTLRPCLPPLAGVAFRFGQVTVTVVEVGATAVTEDPSSSTGTGGGVTIVCEPPLETAPSLAPGESLECTAKTVIVQDDVNRGKVLRDKFNLVYYWDAGF